MAVTICRNKEQRQQQVIVTAAERSAQPRREIQTPTAPSCRGSNHHSAIKKNQAARQQHTDLHTQSSHSNICDIRTITIKRFASTGRSGAAKQVQGKWPLEQSLRLFPLHLVHRQLHPLPTSPMSLPPTPSVPGRWSQCLMGSRFRCEREGTEPDRK